ncbi:hypothetical protein [Haloarcula sp. CBA1131]|uniref:hypothetical protein n=1 Tax=Haloarcula sp. CBA1131 TaxID=1853686 RepID=UPI001CD97978|nr:hypothetical protein [Haloarcula sp. CBA1131]
MGMPFVPAALFFPALGLAALAEVFLYILHKVRPDHYRLTEWLRVRLFWLVKKHHYTHDQGNQDTRQVTRLERIMPHGIERVDGAYVGAVEVEPANMALQDDEKWDKAVTSLTRLSESLTGRAKLHVTTAEVDNKSHIESHINRLEDPDAKSHPIFRGVLTEFVNRYTDDSGTVETETEIQRKYYIIVWVTDDDIHDLQMNSDSIADYLAGMPAIGRLFARFDSDTLTEAEREEFKAKKLHDRLGTVDRAVSNLYRCRSRSVSPTNWHT